MVTFAAGSGRERARAAPAHAFGFACSVRFATFPRRPRSRLRRAECQAKERVPCECFFVPVFERRPMRHSRLIFASGAIAAAALLAGCGTDRTGDCPTITGVTDASVATVFRPGTTSDPSNVLYTVELTNVQGQCDIDKKERYADASLEISFRATRAPSGNEAHYTIPYFVAITEGSERILVKRSYSVAVEFEPGQTTATVSDTVGSTHLEPAKDKHPYDYQILVGLQLSKAQLDYNRQGGHFGS